VLVDGVTKVSDISRRRTGESFSLRNGMISTYVSEALRARCSYKIARQVM